MLILPLWQHWLSGGIIWAVPIGFLIWFFISTPAPGMASVVCGGFVALMVLREMTASHKFLCTFLVLALVSTEIRSIRIDRLKQDADHIHAESNLQKEFKDTQSQIENVLTQDKVTLNTILGGDAYPTVEPVLDLLAGSAYEARLPAKNKLPNKEGFYLLMRLRNNGSYPLTGLRVDLSENAPQNEQPQDVINLPDTLAPNTFVDYAFMYFAFREFQGPFPFKEDFPAFRLFYFSAQNGVYSEQLEVHPTHLNGNITYACRYTIYKGFKMDDKHKIASREWTEKDDRP